MKKLAILTFTASFLTLLSLHSTAQFLKRTMMLGTTVGSAGYSSANSEYDYQSGESRSAGTNTFTFNVGPQIGFFLTPRFVLGATPAFDLNNSISTNKTSGDVTNTFNNYMLNTETNGVTFSAGFHWFLKG